MQELDRELGWLAHRECVDLGGEKVTQLIGAMGEINMALQSILHLEVQVKDFDRGLIDFPAIREGREVLLCWELKERDIEYWHDLETGYTGREPL